MFYKTLQLIALNKYVYYYCLAVVCICMARPHRTTSFDLTGEECTRRAHENVHRVQLVLERI